MHELSICQALIEVAADALARVPAPSPRVLRVTVRVGRLTAVVPEALRFHFDLLTPGTVLEGAELVIEEVPARGRCAACLYEFAADGFPSRCPACGARDVLVSGGQDLDVVALDVADDDAQEPVDVAHTR
ncbi:MAG: hydrogenase maturation nickel metallochaperone HypA [Armatimonadota bacterium]|nr:hydrogenase maturation nickel metallochaperone HypA [Armatimonadota bacterium]